VPRPRPLSQDRREISSILTLFYQLRVTGGSLPLVPGIMDDNKFVLDYIIALNNELEGWRGRVRDELRQRLDRKTIGRDRADPTIQ
jgi:hypothetical protein